MCHTDVHFVKEGLAPYPLTPGHELAGVVTKVGRNVTKLRVGDAVAVGCMVDSCFGCRSCRAYEEQYCLNGAVWTYGGETKYGRAGPDGKRTRGGYSDAFVANQRFCFKLPPESAKTRDEEDASKTTDTKSSLAKYAPLLCAGVTTFDPLVRYGCLDGRKRVGVAGFGGLGMMATKLARAMRCDVVALSSSPNKEPAARRMGASEFWVTTDAEAMKEKAEAVKAQKHTHPKRDAAVYGWQHPDPPPAGSASDPDEASGDDRVSLDVILDTVSAPHDVAALVDLLAPDGTLVLLGLAANALVFSRKVVRGSLIAGTKSTEACLEFCVEHGVFPDVRVIDAAKAADALKALDKKNDAAVRYVIDCETIPKRAKRSAAA